MRRWEDKRIALELQRLRDLQETIIKEWGEEYVALKGAEFCYRCTTADCILLPIDSKGNNCPYFKKTASLSE